MKIPNLFLSLALLPAAGFAQSGAKPSALIGPVISGSVSTSDRKFVRAAAQGGMAEVELANSRPKRDRPTKSRNLAGAWPTITARRAIS
jgi:hypothetical protein